MNQDKDTAGSTSDSFSKDRSLKSEAAVGKGKLAEFAETAASAGKAQLDSGLGQAAGQVEQVAKVIDDTASRLKQENQEGLAAYATQVAGSIESVANRLRHSSVDELATEARQLARSNPVMFLLGSVAIGFGMTRFLKASSRISDVEDFGGYRDPGGAYGDSRTPTRDWQSSSPGRAQGAWDSDNGSIGNPGGGNGSSSAGSHTAWDRASGTTGGASAGLGGSTGTGSSTGLGSTGLGGSTGAGGSSGFGSSTGAGASSGLGASAGLSGSTGSGSGTASSGTRSGTDSLDELRAKPMFPEMKTDGLKPGGTVGGSRTNEIGGGSHG